MKTLNIPLSAPVSHLEDLIKICLDLRYGDSALRITDHLDEALQGGYINVRDERFIELLILAIVAHRLYGVDRRTTAYRTRLRQLAHAWNLNPTQLERQIDEQEHLYRPKQPRWARYFKVLCFQPRPNHVRRDAAA